MDITRNGQTITFRETPLGDLVQESDYLSRADMVMPLKNFLLGTQIIMASNLPLARHARREWLAATAETRAAAAAAQAAAAAEAAAVRASDEPPMTREEARKVIREMTRSNFDSALSDRAMSVLSDWDPVFTETNR